MQKPCGRRETGLGGADVYNEGRTKRPGPPQHKEQEIEIDRAREFSRGKPI